MAHFAEIDENNIVQRVLVVHNDIEHRGAEFLANDLGLGGTWIQCSYNGGIRKNFPNSGFVYDATRDAFIVPQPFPSWSLDEATCRWVPPTPKPAVDGWRWDEATLTWKEIV